MNRRIAMTENHYDNGNAVLTLLGLADEIRTMHDDDRDHTPAELRESAYRRGVQQGFEMARQILAKAGDETMLVPHARRLSEWRYRVGEFAADDRAEVISPPWPGSPPFERPQS